MKDIKAAVAIRIRLKYDWIVILYGLLCGFAQIICKGDLGYFLIVLGAFMFVEIFAVALYRKLQNGGEGYHMQIAQTLDQQTGVGLIVFAMVIELAFLFAVSMGFLMSVFRHCVN